MPEMLVLSGLDDVGQGLPSDTVIGPNRDYLPWVKDTPNDPSALLWGLGAIAVFYAIGFAVSKFSGKKATEASSDLGVIKRCRKSDLTSKKPKSKQQWCLWTKSESRIIGRHPSKSRAVKQERLIEMKKHGISTRR
jgi:hypothetical protein